MKPSRVIAASESLALLTVSAGELASSSDPTLPSPRKVVGTLGFYGLLGLVAGFGDGPARFAAAVGGVTLITLLVAGPGGRHLLTLINKTASL